MNFHFPASGNNEKKIDSPRRIKLSSEEKHSVLVAERMEKRKIREICQPGRKDGRRTEFVKADVMVYKSRSCGKYHLEN